LKRSFEVPTTIHGHCVVEVCRFEGGHEWSDAFYRVARVFLSALER
jgi:hypothetical protein